MQNYKLRLNFANYKKTFSFFLIIYYMSDCDCDTDEEFRQEYIDCDFIDSPYNNTTSAVPSDGVHKVAPPGTVNIPENMEIEGYRFSLPLEAIKWTNEQRFKLARDYNKKFNVHKYIWSFEIKEKGDVENNPHLHMFCILKKPKKSTKCDFIKSLSNLIRKDSMGRLMYKPEREVKNTDSYLAYIIKDGNYITNFTEEEIEWIECRKEDIQEDMKKSVRHKLLDKITLLNARRDVENIWDMNTLADIIINIYIFDWDKEPPLHKVKSQALYVGRKLGIKLAMTEKIMFWQ